MFNAILIELLQKFRCAGKAAAEAATGTAVIRSLTPAVERAILASIARQQILPQQKTFIGEYDFAKGRVEIGFGNAFGGAAYLLTARGDFLYGDERCPIYTAIQRQECRQLHDVIASCDPHMGLRLVGYAFDQNGRVCSEAVRPTIYSKANVGSAPAR